MDLLFEFILELVLEGSIELSKSKKVPKYIRYPLIGLIVLFFTFVIGFLLFAGILSIKKNLLVGLMILALVLFFLIMSIVKFRETYLLKISKKIKNNKTLL